MSTGGKAKRPRFGQLWRNGDFLKFWAGETVSLFGAQVAVLALPLTAVLILDSDTEQVGLLRLMLLLPYLLFAMLFGAIADRRRRRPLMIGANAVRAVLLAFVPILAVADLLDLNALYAITFGVGLAAVMFDVCWLSYVPTLIDDRNLLIEANGKLGTTASTADIAGPGVAGGLVQLVTAPYALAVNAGSYLLSIVSLLLIRVKEPPPRQSGPDKRNLLKEAGEGLRWVFGNKTLRVLALLGGSYNFFLTFIETIFLVYAVRALAFGPGGIGLVLGAGAVGGLLGAIMANSMIRRLGLGKVYTASVLVAFSAWILVPVAGGPGTLAVVMPVAALFLTSTGIGLANVIVLSLRQAVTPSGLMARMNAAMRMLMFGVAALGGPAGGFIAGWLGLRQALWIGSIASILVVIPLFRSGITRMKTLPEPAPEPQSMVTERDVDIARLVGAFVRLVPGIAHAAVASADDQSLDGSKVWPPDQVWAVARGLFTFTAGAARTFNAGRVTRTVVDMDGGYLFVVPVSGGSCLTVLTEAGADLRLVGHEITVLVGHLNRLGMPQAGRPLITVAVEQ